MLVRLAVLADAANLSVDGKLNILGEFNLIRSTAFPASWGRLFLVVKLEAQPGDGGVHPFRLRVVDDDGIPLDAPSATGRIDFGPRFSEGVPLGGPLIIEIRGATFPRAGTYEFEVAVGDPTLVTASIPLYVFAMGNEQGPSLAHQ